MTKMEQMQTANGANEISVIVATDADGGVDQTLARYRPALDGMDLRYELIVIVDGGDGAQLGRLQAMALGWDELTVIGQRPWSGEDAALAAAVRRSTADRILMLPGWSQIHPDDLPELVDALAENDMVSAVRSDRRDGKWQNLRGGLFARVLRRLFGRAPADPFCRVHLVRRETLEDVTSFGVRQHFLSVIAAQRGHVVAEVDVRPAPAAGDVPGDGGYVFKPLGHIRALFDAIALYVVLTFLRRPLRFFGAIGLPIFLLGTITTLVLVGQRLFGETALADRPALIFSVMMVVLGIQIIAIGLVGEIIIFANARRMKQYEVAEIITSGDRSDANGTRTTNPRGADVASSVDG